MSILTHSLPKGIISGGKYYPINTDFRVWLKFGTILSDSTVPPLIKAEKIMRLCFVDRLPDCFDDAFSALLDFYSPNGSNRSGDGKKRVFSFEKDADLIYAAFLSEYGIDLCTTKLHWRQFVALFSALSPESRLMQVIGYRNIDPTEFKDTKKRAFYRKMKRMYALDDEKGVEPADILAQLF